MAIISPMCSVARGSISGGNEPSCAMSAWKSAMVRAVSTDRFAQFERPRVDLVLNVGDVAHVGKRADTAAAAAAPTRRRPPPAARCRMREVVDRRAAHVHPHMRGSSGSNRSFRRVRLLCRKSSGMALGPRRRGRFLGQSRRQINARRLTGRAGAGYARSENHSQYPPARPAEGCRP